MSWPSFITLAEQIAEAQRELALRRTCYPQWIQEWQARCGRRLPPGIGDGGYCAHAAAPGRGGAAVVVVWEPGLTQGASYAAAPAAVPDAGGNRPLRNYRPRADPTRSGAPQREECWRAAFGCLQERSLGDVPQRVRDVPWNSKGPLHGSIGDAHKVLDERDC